MKQQQMVIVECRFCKGGSQDPEGTCSECGGIAVWGILAGHVVYALLPQMIRVGIFYELKQALINLGKLFGLFSGLLLIGLIASLIAQSQFEGYELGSTEFWQEFRDLWLVVAGLWGIFLFWLYLSIAGRNSFRSLPEIDLTNTAQDQVLAQRTWPQLKAELNKKQFLNMNKFTDYRLRDVINRAARLRSVRRFGVLNVPSLLLVLASQRLIQRVLKRLELPPRELEQKLESLVVAAGDEAEAGAGVRVSPGVKRDLVEAVEVSWLLRHRLILIQDVFAASLNSEKQVQQFFQKHDITYELQLQAVRWVDAVRQEFRWWSHWDITHFRRAGKLDQGWSSGWTVLLDKYSQDLTKQARHGLLPQFVGREQVLQTMDRVLAQSQKNNVLLIGETGVGRTTLVEGLANRIVRGEVSDTLKNKRIVLLNIGALVGGAADNRQFSNAMQTIIDEVTRAKNIILFVDNLHLLRGTGAHRGGELDALQLLEPMLGRSQVQVIGTSNFEEYRKLQEQVPDLRSMFEVVELQEPSYEDCLDILLEAGRNFERIHRVIFSMQAISASITLGTKYLRDKVHPDKALNLLDEAAVLASRRKGEGYVVTREDIHTVVASKTNVPVQDVRTEEGDALLHLENKLEQRVIGQKQAITSVASAVRRARVGLKAENRPIATFLFVGPTGVGKTELAKALSTSYFGHENMLMRLDMSEYQEVASLRRLIGGPLGSGEEHGLLTEAVRQRPFSLILLDEFEKAHRDIHNVFLQVFDDGRLSDSHGRVVDFSNTVIIATSNVGAKYIQEALLKKVEIATLQTQLRDEILPQQFKPELINRFDEVIVFEPLKQAQMAQIAQNMIAKVIEQLEQQQIRIKVTSEAAQALGEMGYDPIYGARPLRRLIQEKLEDLLAGKILRGELKKGDSLVIREDDVR